MSQLGHNIFLFIFIQFLIIVIGQEPVIIESEITREVSNKFEFPKSFSFGAATAA